ncbi:araC-type DNA-binding domain-containing proteins [Zymobacter palmae]|uniref:AraC-type DNA-binding domain-containing proteins n=1 Tax=Zymobacter palmae TaxID=33074 RepID=A0A348HFJ8_9GAMM|nr:araC-type DNA-binding domain-containing proteins [Zymobacter palmae]
MFLCLLACTNKLFALFRRKIIEQCFDQLFFQGGHGLDHFLDQLTRNVLELLRHNYFQQLGIDLL